MKLLDMWITETLQSAPLVVELPLPINAPPPEEQIPIAVTRVANTKEAEREFQALLQRKCLWADETKRLGELAAMLGLQVQVQRHDFATGEATTLVLP